MWIIREDSPHLFCYISAYHVLRTATPIVKSGGPKNRCDKYVTMWRQFLCSRLMFSV